VSKLVSVKFHKTDQAGPASRTTLETPVSGPLVDQEEDQPQKREDTIEMVMAK
jgi:hypothetical protein